jgi:hypothetical protein
LSVCGTYHYRIAHYESGRRELAVQSILTMFISLVDL